MSKRSCTGTDILDWWQNVADGTKDLLDDTIARVRNDDDDDDLAAEVADLKKTIASLNAKLDTLADARKPGAGAATAAGKGS